MVEISIDFLVKYGYDLYKIIIKNCGVIASRYMRYRLQMDVFAGNSSSKNLVAGTIRRNENYSLEQ